MFINVISDDANDSSENISEQVHMVEVNTESDESDELFSVCENTIMVTNHSRQHNITSESKNYTLIKFKFTKIIF